MLLEIRMVQEIARNGGENLFNNVPRFIWLCLPAAEASGAEPLRDAPLQVIPLIGLQPRYRYDLPARGAFDAIIRTIQCLPQPSLALASALVCHCMLLEESGDFPLRA